MISNVQFLDHYTSILMIIFPPKSYGSHRTPIFGIFPHGWKLPSWERLPAHDTVLPNLWAAGIWPQVVFFSLGVFPPFFGIPKGPQKRQTLPIPFIYHSLPHTSTPIRKNGLWLTYGTFSNLTQWLWQKKIMCFFEDLFPSILQQILEWYGGLLKPHH